MSSYHSTMIDLIEYRGVKHSLPLAIDDMSLAFHLGIHNRTLWFFILEKNKLYNTFDIDKRGKGTGKRGIQDPDKRLKRAQKVMLSKFLNPIPVGEHIGAYVPGRSCMATAQQHVGKGVIISMDIKDFFPSVKRAMVRHYFRSLGYAHRVASLMADLVTYKNFLPQGAPTSGMVANLVADQRFDRTIMRELKELGPDWVYTRYSDDIDISHPDKPTREGVAAVVNLVRARVKEAGFTINENKTRTEPYWNRQKVLGIVVNEKPNVQRTDYMHVRCMIHNCMMHGFASQCERADKESIGALISHIRGKLNYFKQIDPIKSGHLQKLFDAAVDMHAEETADEVDFSDG